MSLVAPGLASLVTRDWRRRLRGFHKSQENDIHSSLTVNGRGRERKKIVTSRCVPSGLTERQRRKKCLAEEERGNKNKRANGNSWLQAIRPPPLDALESHRFPFIHCALVRAISWQRSLLLLLLSLSLFFREMSKSSRVWGASCF